MSCSPGCPLPAAGSPSSCSPRSPSRLAPLPSARAPLAYAEDDPPPRRPNDKKGDGFRFTPPDTPAAPTPKPGPTAQPSKGEPPDAAHAAIARLAGWPGQDGIAAAETLLLMGPEAVDPCLEALSKGDAARPPGRRVGPREGGRAGPRAVHPPRGRRAPQRHAARGLLRGRERARHRADEEVALLVPDARPPRLPGPGDGVPRRARDARGQAADRRARQRAGAAGRRARRGARAPLAHARAGRRGAGRRARSATRTPTSRCAPRS